MLFLLCHIGLISSSTISLITQWDVVGTSSFLPECRLSYVSSASGPALCSYFVFSFVKTFTSMSCLLNSAPNVTVRIDQSWTQQTQALSIEPQNPPPALVSALSFPICLSHLYNLLVLVFHTHLHVPFLASDFSDCEDRPDLVSLLSDSDFDTDFGLPGYFPSRYSNPCQFLSCFSVDDHSVATAEPSPSAT